MKKTRLNKGYYKFMKGYDRYLTKEFKADYGNKPKLRIRQLQGWNLNPFSNVVFLDTWVDGKLLADED